jgi:ornithine carbamoyltransferase
MKGKSLRSLADFTDAEVRRVLELAARLKEKKKTGVRGDSLAQKSVALVFEKASTRTRCAASVAVTAEGGHAEYLGAQDIHLGRKESVADTARVLGRMYDGILFRGFAQETVDTLAGQAGVPVWNGLTDEWHPTQILADIMTITEAFGDTDGVKVVFIGDGRNNVANSLMFGCARMGMEFVNCAPPELAPREDLVERARELAGVSQVTVEPDPVRAVDGANVVYTDVWASMGEEKKFEQRASVLKSYQVNMALMEATGNLSSGRAIFLHCLPAYHDNRTEFTKERGALEVTDEVFSSGFSKVFDEAENRVYTLGAVMVATLAGE